MIDDFGLQVGPLSFKKRRPSLDGRRSSTRFSKIDVERWLRLPNIYSDELERAADDDPDDPRGGRRFVS
jgi:hypothetical protein